MDGHMNGWISLSLILKNINICLSVLNKHKGIHLVWDDSVLMHFFINLDLDKYYSYISFGKSCSVPLKAH